MICLSICLIVRLKYLDGDVIMTEILEGQSMNHDVDPDGGDDDDDYHNPHSRGVVSSCWTTGGLSALAKGAQIKCQSHGKDVSGFVLVSSWSWSTLSLSLSL